MSTFKHVNATTIADAATQLAKGKADVIAGGTIILHDLRTMNTPNLPETLVNIKTIPGLAHIKEEGGMLKIGATTILTDIYESSLVKEKYTALAQAAGKVGTPELRNMGTMGGNICQSVQCWYYRSAYNFYNCVRKSPGGTCFALTGDNRYNSIFGAVGGCVAVNPSDMAPALVALNASIVTNKKTWKAADFFVPKGEQINSLDEGEIVTEIQVPAPAAGTKSAFVKFALRKSFDFPIVNCAAVVTSAGGTVSSASIVLGAVHNSPRLATAAADSLKGKTLDAGAAEAAGTAALAGAAPLSENKYMVPVAKAMVKKALLACK